MKYLSKFLVIAIVAASIVSCKKDDTPAPPVDPNVTFKATLNGANEFPTPNTSANTGTATLVFNTTTKIFTITVSHTIATPTIGHIHKGAAGASGAPVFTFSPPPVSPVTYTSAALDAAQEADLNAGLYYVNIHSATPYGAGEIRGQLLK
jgi:CHRD domain